MITSAGQGTGDGWKTLRLSAAAAQTVGDTAADPAADAADAREDQRGHHRRDDGPEPPDGLTGPVLAGGHHVGALVVPGASSSVEFGESLGDGSLGIIEGLLSRVGIVISQ